jgi:tripartite-type tricarboxylate transporter receptor subunit TctC
MRRLIALVLALLAVGVVAAAADPYPSRPITIVVPYKKLGQDIWPADHQTPQALAARQQAETAKWTPIIKSTGIAAQ